MFPRWLPLWSVALWTMVSVASGQAGVCNAPANAIPAHISQMKGTWYLQLEATSDDATPNSVCPRIEIVVTGKDTAMEVRDGFDPQYGQFWEGYSEVTQLDPVVARYIPLPQPNVHYDTYTLLLTDDALVMSTCQYADGKPVQQYVQIRTRTQTVDRKYLEDLLTRVNVNNSNKKFYSNPPFCYAMNCTKTCKSD